MYYWKNEIEHIDMNDIDPELIYELAASRAQQFGGSIDDEMSCIYNVFKVEDHSILASLLEAWWKKKGMDPCDDVTGYLETRDGFYFVTGCGYALFDCDLLGGNGNGEAESAFTDFVEQSITIDADGPSR